MNEVQFSYPCKCGHEKLNHFEYNDSSGGWIFNKDVGHEVWMEESYPRPVCDLCNNDCSFEQMNGLEYLEWKYNEKRTS